MTKAKQRSDSFLNWRSATRSHPSAFLLAAQLVSLVLFAIVDPSLSGRVVLGVFGVLLLALVVWVVNRSPALNWIAWVLVAPAVILSLLSIWYRNPVVFIVSSVLEAILYFYAAGSMVAYMMKDYRVTADELFAAGATFTLLAWGFAYLYLACQLLLPGSFIGLNDPEEPRTFIEIMSLSFTNLTATGLGDVLPIGPLARVLVMLEQFSGIGYVAVVVSRLIGMTLLQLEDQRKT
jgi:hypothetical protein